MTRLPQPHSPLRTPRSVQRASTTAMTTTTIRTTNSTTTVCTSAPWAGRPSRQHTRTARGAPLRYGALTRVACARAYQHRRASSCDRARRLKCSDSLPSLAQGEWYVVAGKFGNTSDAAGDCCRMKFSLPGDRMNQWMMYNKCVRVCAMCGAPARAARAHLPRSARPRLASSSALFRALIVSSADVVAVRARPSPSSTRIAATTTKARRTTSGTIRAARSTRTKPACGTTTAGDVPRRAWSRERASRFLICVPRGPVNARHGFEFAFLVVP